MSVFTNALLVADTSANVRLRQMLSGAAQDFFRRPCKYVGGTNGTIIELFPALGGNAYTKVAPSQVYNVSHTINNTPPAGFTVVVDDNGNMSADSSTDGTFVMQGIPNASKGATTKVGFVRLNWGASHATTTSLSPGVGLDTTDRQFGLKCCCSSDGSILFITSYNSATTQDLYIYTGSVGTGTWTLTQTITGITTVADGSSGYGGNLDCNDNGDYVVLGVYVYRKAGASWTLTATLGSGGNASCMGATSDTIFTSDNANVYVYDRSGNNWNLTTTITSTTYGPTDDPGPGSIFALHCSDNGTSLAMFCYNTRSGTYDQSRWKRLTLSGTWSLSENFIVSGDLLFTSGGRQRCIRIDPNGGTSWVAGTGFVLYTQDFVS